MMVKASDEYYNLEKVAEVLNVPTAEVNRLREQNKLRGFRDGSNWKFRKEDVHSYLAESIKARSGSSGLGASDSDFDLAGDEDAVSFDLLMEEAALPDDSDLVSIAPANPKSDLDLAALDQEESDLALAEETQVAPMVMPQKPKAPDKPVTGVSLDKEDSSALHLAPDPEVHEVDFELEESILEAEGSSPQLGLAGDSAFDVLLAGDSDNILALDEASTEAVSVDAASFDLEPSPVMMDDDDSESLSQVMPIDIPADMGEPAAQEGGAFGSDDFDFMGFDSGVVSPADSAQAAPFDPGFDSPSFSGAFGDASSTDSFSSSNDEPMITPLITPAKTATVKQEEEYSTGILVTLVLAVVVMLLPTMMLVDSMLNIWSWGQPSSLNSMVMSTVAGWFGL